MSSGDEINDKVMRKLIATFAKAAPVVKVGILGDKNARSSGKATNASIGMDHEFGLDGHPQRSFLRVPISENLQKYLDKSGAFGEDVLKQVIANGDIVKWMFSVGITAETIVKDAFASNGFGQWAPHAPGYENNTGQVLVDTQQLRDSITSEVE